MTLADSLPAPPTLIVVADNPLWLAMLRRGLSALGLAAAVRIELRSRSDLEDGLQRPLLIETSGSLALVLAQLRDARRQSPDRLIVALGLPTGDHWGAALRSTDLVEWLHEAGASATIVSPCDFRRITHLLARLAELADTAPNAAPGLPRLPVGWHSAP
jgi:hypothetical protein